MIQSLFKMFITSLLVLSFVVQATSIAVPNSCEDPEQTDSSVVAGSLLDLEQQDDCCELDCCDANCFCLGGASSNAVYLPLEFVNFTLPLPNNSVIADDSAPPLTMSSTLYRPPINA